MTKAQLALEVALKVGIEQSDVLEVIDEMLAQIKQQLAQSEPVFLRGFGTFQAQHRPEKRAWNLREGTPVVIPAQAYPKIKFSKEFKLQVKDAPKK